MITSGTTICEWTESSITLDINVSSLCSNTVYYLVLWMDNQIVYLNQPTTLNLEYGNEPIIGKGSKFKPYECYIDNGVSWEPYRVFINK